MGSRIPAKRLLPAVLPLDAEADSPTNFTLLSTETSSSYGGIIRPPHHRQKRVACRGCRQAKLKCDWGNLSGSAPCSRCRRLSRECRVESDYKRVNKRTKLDELAEQVERLSSVVGQGGGSHGFDGLVADDGQTINIDSSSQTPPQTGPPTQQLSPQYTVDRIFRPTSISREGRPRNDRAQTRNQSPGNGVSRSLEDVELDYSEISCLFKEFFENYHRFLEILDPSISPGEYYTRSPLLFWCIICVAARHYERRSTLLTILSPCVTRLLWTTVSVLPHSRFTVQALLLVSMWTFPTDSMSKDISFMVVSLAKSACMQLGLHRPETVQDFLRVKTTFGPQEFQEAVKIWTGCFISTHSVPASAGQPSTFSGDWAIDQACEVGNRYTLPENNRCQLLIYKFIARVNKVMTESDRSPTGYPPEAESCMLMSILETDFSTLERQISHRVTDLQSILLSMACVQLRTYYFFMSPGTDVRKQGLLKSYAAAVTFILKVADADDKWSFTHFAPSGVAQMLTIAAMVLLKVVNSSYANHIDTEEGRRAFNTAASLIRKTSVEDNDLQGRVNKIIAQLWSLHHNLNQRKEEEPTVHINTRWGASLLHDSLWTWREEFGGQKALPPVLNSPSTSSPSNLRPIFTDPPLGTPRSIEGWSTKTNISKNLPIGQQNPTSRSSEVPGFDNIMGVPDMDWIWDVGFPSVMPIDIDSYEGPDADRDFRF